MDMYGVSRATIRQAINELVSDGYLTRKKGKGTFVSKKRLVQFGYLESLYETVKEQGHEIQTKVLELQIVSEDKKSKEILQLDPEEEIVRLRRLRFIDEVPNHLVVNYLPAARFGGIVRYDFEKESLSKVLKEDYGVAYTSQDSIIEAHISGKYESELLVIPVGSPIQYVETVNCGKNDNPVDYYTVRYRGDQHQIRYQIKM
jgi:GntR family transcriptional regulator